MTGQSDFYASRYRRFSSDLAAELRREVYDEDMGQQGWRTIAEQAEIGDFLRLGKDSNSSMWPVEVVCPRLHWLNRPDVA
jgi:hypothetical protein